MKKEIVLALTAFFLISMSAFTGAYAGDKASNKKVTISKDKVDLTGDGKKDTIVIKGIPYEEESDFFREFQMEVVASNNQSFTVNIDGGLKPKAKFVDLNHDRTKDVYISVETGSRGRITNHYLYTLKNNKLLDLTVPDPLVIMSQFLDSYKASITIQDIGESYTFDLKSRTKNYEMLGLYQNGKLSEPTELMVDAYSTLKPVHVEGKTYGLKGIQAISGVYHSDRIAQVETIWLFENGKWALKYSKIMESKK
ncbi:hypothetical protein [Cytobacillus dafuensis]|uniref:VCBS repeat-containing protein n=1 Tax=Cytobacillus dafuensis TaxID=1742359 RepID=A0A5B8Z7S2_CYTDA|nr:hypothetical protein [Cytobacillus dafuensis]QED47749.1 hypothetical protein FSZ17_11045 [Cytobacillus dafuensis]